MYKDKRPVGGGKPIWIIIDDNGEVINRSPSKEELKGLERYIQEQYPRENKRIYNRTNTCPICRERGRETKLIPRNSLREYDKEGKLTGRRICKSCYNRYRTYGTYTYEKPLKIYNKTNTCPRCEEGGIETKLSPGNAFQERDKGGKATGIWICKEHYMKDYNKNGRSTWSALKSIAGHRTGNLDPNCTSAKGDLGEELSNEWRGTKNLNKENDNYLSPIDHSRDPELGIIQTKIAWYNSKNRCWSQNFKNEHDKDFDNLILHCISNDGKIVERTYIIPSWEIIGRTGVGITKYDSKGRLYKRGWYKKYILKDEEEQKKINEIWQKILDKNK